MIGPLREDPDAGCHAIGMQGQAVDVHRRGKQFRGHALAEHVKRIVGGDQVAVALDTHVREHLYRLARPASASSAATVRDTVNPALRQLMDIHLSAPAFVANRTLDVLATNAMADALFSLFDPVDNLARMTFSTQPGNASTRDGTGPLRQRWRICGWPSATTPGPTPERTRPDAQQ